jgi:hypothetical protein
MRWYSGPRPCSRRRRKGQALTVLGSSFASAVLEFEAVYVQGVDILR